MQGDTVYLTKAQSYYCNDLILNIVVYLGFPVIFYEAWTQHKRAKKQKEELRQIEEKSEKAAFDRSQSVWELNQSQIRRPFSRPFESCQRPSYHLSRIIRISK
jgi:hypothetical protein